MTDTEILQWLLDNNISLSTYDWEHRHETSIGIDACNCCRIEIASEAGVCQVQDWETHEIPEGTDQVLTRILELRGTPAP